MGRIALSVCMALFATAASAEGINLEQRSNTLENVITVIEVAKACQTWKANDGLMLLAITALAGLPQPEDKAMSEALHVRWQNNVAKLGKSVCVFAERAFGPNGSTVPNMMVKK